MEADEDELDSKLVMQALPPEVEAAIAEVLGSHDPLDSADFNPIDYINKLFPNEQSLSGIDTVVSKLRIKIRRLDTEIRDVIHTQTNVGEQGLSSLQESQKAIQELSLKIKDIRQKAELSEMMVQEITRDIKSLDYAKKHLTASINTLNHMHMLIGGVESLSDMSRRRQYRDAANLLQAVMNIMQEFDKYRDIPKVRSVTQEVQKVKMELKLQVRADFDDSFTTKVLNGSADHLREACGVVEVLGEDCKREIIDWFVRLQLADYRIVFPDGQEVSSLEKLDRRYAWVKRTVGVYEDECKDVFPPSWRMSEAICLQFCNWCRKDLVSLLSARRETLDVKLLLQLVQKTVNFEKYLTARFGAEGPPKEEEEEEEDLAKVVVEKLTQPKAPSKFTGIISSCFEPYMNIYIEAQDKKLAEMIEQFVREARASHKEVTDGKVENITTSGPAKVLGSSSDLFFFYKNCMVQCATLSTKEPLFQLYKVFGRYLRMYSSKVLTGTIPGSSLLAAVAGISEVRLSQAEEYVVCTIINTAEYCLDTTKQLEIKMKEKVDSAYKAKIDLNEEQDALHEVISTCLQQLVKNIETVVDDMCNELSKRNWAMLTGVGDCSSYVNMLENTLKHSIPVVRNGVAAKYFNNFCLKIVNSLIPRYITALYKCRTVTTVAAEQLLLDCHSIKETLVNMHSLDTEASVHPPASYTKYVAKGMAKAEMSLKVVMTPSDPALPFVQTFLALMPEKDFATFQKIVDMRSLKKTEEQALYDEFAKATGTSRAMVTASLQQRRDMSTADRLAGAVGESNRLKKLEEFISKFQ